MYPELTDLDLCTFVVYTVFGIEPLSTQSIRFIKLIVFIDKELPSLYETVTFGYIRSEQVFSIVLCLRIYGSYQDGYHNFEAVTPPCTDGFHTTLQKSKPPVKLVVCTRPSRAYYRLVHEGTLKVWQPHLTHEQPLKRLFFLLTGSCYP